MEQANSPPHADDSRAHCIIVHPLYGSVQLPGSGPVTSPIDSVHIKLISVVAYAAGVLSRKRTSHFTTPFVGSFMCKPHYHTPAVRMRISPWQQSPHVILVNSPPHGFTHVQTALSRTRCIYLYSSLSAGPLPHP